MNGYLINLLIIIGIGLISLTFKSKETRKKIFLYASFIDMFLFLSLRSIDVGIDLPNYFYFFDKCNEHSWATIFSYRYEPGFIIYTKIIANVFNNKQLFLSVTALLSLAGPFYIIKKYSKNYFLGIFLYITFQFFTYDFYLLRQIIAMSITMLSLKFVEEKKLIKFILMIVLATCFHTSACIFIIVYWLSKINMDNKKVVLVFFIMVAVAIFGNSIINMALNFLYQHYAESEGEAGGYFYFSILMIIFILITAIKNDFFENDKRNIMWYNILIMALFVQLLAIMKPIINRLTIYYSIAIIIALPNAIHSIKEKNTRMLLSFGTFIGFFIFYLTRLDNPITYIDYHFFWS